MRDRELDDSDEWQDHELPDESDMDDSGEEDSTDTAVCPWCGELVYVEAATCPHCGASLASAHWSTHKPLWIILGMIAALVAILAFIFI